MNSVLKLVLIPLAFVTASAAEADQQPTIGFCDGCSTSIQWRVAAEGASLDTFPIYNGTHEVYLINRTSETVQAFSVRRWFENGGVIPQSSGDKDENRQQLASYYRAEATAIPADPIVHGALLDALSAVKDVIDEFKDGPIPIEDLGLLPLIPSAVDLVGPDDSPAGFNRGALATQLGIYANERVMDGLLVLYDLAQRFANQILADSMVNAMGTFIISFPDGTLIEVRLEAIYETAHGGVISFTLDVSVLPHSAYGPGLPFVPQSAGQFGNFGYSGNGTTMAAILRLARLYGIPVTGQGGGDGDRFQCEIVGSQIKCRMTGSSD